MVIHLTFLHWTYLVFILLILGFMVMKRDTTLISLIGIFVLGLIGTSSIVSATAGVFSSLVYAINQLLDIILVISVIVALSSVMTKTGINDVMIRPFTKFIKNPTLAFWIIGIIMMIVSWFFWPSPAVALLGVILLPVALRVGLPALGVAISMNLFGHGIALSGDYIIQGAPKLTASAAGISTSSVMAASVPLVIVMGVVTTVTAFFFLRRDMKRGKLTVTDEDIKSFETDDTVKNSAISVKAQKFFAILIPVLLILDVIGMLVFHLQGGDATALIGGTVVFILSLVSISAHKNKGLEKITDYLIEGLQFGFKVFGPVIPIAAYFYMGDMGITHVFGKGVLPAGSQGIVSDLGAALAHSVPVNAQVAAGTLTAVGAITGLDGSGFAGITLAGSIAHLFGTAIGHGIATLTALGQISAIYVGGGTIIPWALIPVAAICKVDAFELARRNLVPVLIGFIVTTIVAMFLI